MKQAKHDLEIAEKNITIGGYDIAAFLSHQSVEKLLKSIFAFEGKKIPKIHYIEDLGKRLNLSNQILDEVIDLTGDYTFSRYPDVSEKVPYEIYNEDIAKDKVEKAKHIFEHLEYRYKELLENEG
ncbi:MAG: HEPN domain-containing protein [Candidatus Odinarchaeota archaeon]